MDFKSIFEQKLDRLIIEEMERTNTAGTAVAVVNDGKLEMTRCYGARDFELNKPVTPDTIFNVASVTKSFVCAGILKLQEEDKLNVMDPIAEYLPVKIGFPDNPIRIHHLMNHTSGIPNLADAMWIRNREHFMDAQPVPRIPFSSWEDGFRFLNGAQEYLVPPGKKFHYNNFAYGLLSKIISEVAQESYKKFLRKKLFEPMKMKMTGFFNEIKNTELLAKGYMDKPNSKTNEFIHVPYEEHKLTRSLDEAAGGLFSTVVDLSKYLQMHLNQGDFDGKQILTKESVESMQSMQFREEYPSASFAAAYGQTISGYGYGFAIDEDFYGYKLVQHSGSFIGASAWFCFISELKRGAIMLSNHHPSPRIFSQAIMIQSLGIDPEKEWPLLKLRNLHKELTGEYHTYKGLNKIRIDSQSGSLIIKDLKGRVQGQLLPLNGDPFTLNYYLPTEMGGKEPAQFVKQGGNIWLTIERNRWKKVNQ